MLLVKFDVFTATYDHSRMEWHSESKGFEDALNASIPGRAQTVEAPFLEGGRQRIVLEGAQECFNGQLQVVKETPDPAPKEDPDIVY